MVFIRFNLNSTKNSNSLVYDFYLLVFVLITTTLISPMISLESSKINHNSHNNNNNNNINNKKFIYSSFIERKKFANSAEQKRQYDSQIPNTTRTEHFLQTVRRVSINEFQSIKTTNKTNNNNPHGNRKSNSNRTMSHNRLNRISLNAVDASLTTRNNKTTASTNEMLANDEDYARRQGVTPLDQTTGNLTDFGAGGGNVVRLGSDAGASANEIDYIGYNQKNANFSTGDGPDSDVFDRTLNNNDSSYSYWALMLIFFPLSTIFGNSLVVLSVIKEKSLHTVTNYFVVSLAIADLTVATAVMPFAVYYEVTKKWNMSKTICDAWVATDVMASTASILNLVAIAIDRFIAVTQPLKYAIHKNSNRIYLMIGLVWLLSIAIASPIVAGLNDTPDREIDQCAFNNEKFLIYSSMFSFYIPTIAMIVLYYKIFRVIRSRAKKSTASKAIARKGAKRNIVNGSNDTNAHNTNKLKDKLVKAHSEPNPNNSKNNHKQSASSSPPHLHRPTIDKCNSEKVNLISAGIFKLKNKSSQSSELDNVDLDIIEIHVKETNVDDKNQPNNKEKSDGSSTPQPPKHKLSQQTQLNGSLDERKLSSSPKNAKLSTPSTAETAKKTSRARTAINVLRSQSSALATLSSNKEKKVTKTLAIVLIVFLVCWSPFFAVNNIMKGVCKELKAKCSFIKDEYIAFLTWLGYLNSLLNPIIYTIFNIEFRRAFAKILSEYCCKSKLSNF